MDYVGVCTAVAVPLIAFGYWLYTQGDQRFQQAMERADQAQWQADFAAYIKDWEAKTGYTWSLQSVATQQQLLGQYFLPFFKEGQ